MADIASWTDKILGRTLSGTLTAHGLTLWALLLQFSRR